MQKTYKPDYQGFQNYYKNIKADSTVAIYQKCLKKFFDYYRHSPCRITKQDLIKYIIFIKTKNYSAIYLKVIIFALKAYFKYLNNIGSKTFLNMNIFEDLQLPKVQHHKQKITRYKELKKIFNYIDENSQNDFVKLRDKTMLMLYATTGARHSEISELKLEDVELDSNIIYFLKTKNNKPRVTYLNEKTKKYLKRYLTMRAKLKHSKASDSLFIPFVFYNNKKNTKNNMGYLLYSKIRKFMPTFTLHSLRRGCATDLYDNGASILGISQILGHSNIAITAKYYIQADFKNDIYKHPSCTLQSPPNVR